MQHAGLPCPSPTSGVCSNSCPWSQWCHPNMSCSVIPIASHLESFPESGSFLMSQVFFCIRWPKYWSFSFSISPPSEYSGLFSFMGIQQKDWETPENLTLEASGIWLQYFHRMGKQTLGGHRQNHVHTRSQEKEAIFPQEIVCVQESPEKAWINNILLWGQGHWIQQYRKKSFWRRSPLLSLSLYSLASGQTTGR